MQTVLRDRDLAMAQRRIQSLFAWGSWTCKSCQINQRVQWRHFSSTTTRSEEVSIQAAPEIDFEQSRADGPARIIPASPSYFTGAPVFNDNLLLLQSLLNRYDFLPQVAPDQAPRMAWLRLSQYRSNTGERIAAAKYAQILRILTRLNRIHPQVRPDTVELVLEKFLRPSAAELQQAKPGKVNEYGVAKGVGRRKEASASVRLVEGTGEILINGKSIVDAFPRLHDRESVVWPLKISQRIDKYNIFALVSGGGVTGQAEAITLGLAKALLIHEPALKPLLRRGKSELLRIKDEC